MKQESSTVGPQSSIDLSPATVNNSWGINLAHPVESDREIDKETSVRARIPEDLRELILDMNMQPVVRQLFQVNLDQVKAIPSPQVEKSGESELPKPDTVKEQEEKKE